MRHAEFTEKMSARPGLVRDDGFWSGSCPVCGDGTGDALTVTDDQRVSCAKGCAEAEIRHWLGLGAPTVVSAREFVGRPRKPFVPLLSSKDGKSVLLRREGTLAIAGPSGSGKSYAAYDLAGLFAGEGGEWLSLVAASEQRVLLVPFPGENTEDDVQERLAELVPELDRVSVWDRWEGDDAPVADEDGEAALAAVIAAREIDVVVLDTGVAFLAPYAEGFSVGEGAFVALERVRKRSGRPVAFVLILHTRKHDRRADGPVVEIEEIGGTISKKVDGAVVIRYAGAPESPRRNVRFAKTRKGPIPPAAVASFPQDPDAPPRLTVSERPTACPGRPIKEGTETARIAAWVAQQDGVRSVTQIVSEFGIGESTVSRRRDELDALGIVYGRLPGRGNRRAYGTAEQWAALYGEPVTNPSEVPVKANPSQRAAGVPAASNPRGDGTKPATAQPVTTQPVTTIPAGQESPATAAESVPVTTPPPYGGLRLEGTQPDPERPPKPGNAILGDDFLEAS